MTDLKVILLPNDFKKWIFSSIIHQNNLLQIVFVEYLLIIIYIIFILEINNLGTNEKQIKIIILTIRVEDQHIRYPDLKTK